MKRTPTAYKKLLVFILTLFALVSPISVFAQDTTLTTTVPSSHIIHISVTGFGNVYVDDIPYTSSADIEVQRAQRPEISVQAAAGYKVKSIVWCSKDVTSSFQNGKWTAPELLEDATLIVIFENTSSVPQTGDSSNLPMWISLLILSSAGLGICMIQTRKRKSL